MTLSCTTTWLGNFRVRCPNKPSWCRNRTQHPLTMVRAIETVKRDHPSSQMMQDTSLIKPTKLMSNNSCWSYKQPVATKEGLSHGVGGYFTRNFQGGPDATQEDCQLPRVANEQPHAKSHTTERATPTNNGTTILWSARVCWKCII